MTTAISTPGGLSGPLKGGLLAAAVFAACWGGAIWHWRAMDGTPGAVELALALLVLPLALVGALWFGGRLVGKRAPAPATAAASTPAAAQPAAASLPALAIISSALRSPHGASAEELSSAIAGNQARPDLDRELVDDDGFPVDAARCGDAEDAALREEIGDWLASKSMQDIGFSDEQWRALLLGSAVVAELAGRAGDLLPAEGKPPTLQLLPLLPPDWPQAQRRAAGMWFAHLAGGFGWPAAQVALPSEASVAAPAALLGQLTRAAAKNATPLVALVVACASHIGQDTVDAWAAKGTLSTSSRPQGLVPGEGAAGLLLTDARLAQSLEGITFALLDPVEQAPGAQDGQRADPTLLGALATRATGPAGAMLEEVAMVVADTGQRRQRTLELMGMTSSAMPQLDESEDVLCVGAASGACADVPFMTALALAQHNALVRGGPVLCISNEGSDTRCAVLVRPAAAA